MSIISIPRVTNWRIAGSAGIGGSVGTPIARVAIEAEWIRLPLQNSQTGQSVRIHIATGGIGAALDFGFPAEIHGAFDALPSDGIGSIVTGFLAPEQITPGSFMGNYVHYRSIAGGAAIAGPVPIGASLTGVAFMPSLATTVITSLIPTDIDNAALCSCMGLFWGVHGQSNPASVGGGAGWGRVVDVEITPLVIQGTC